MHRAWLAEMPDRRGSRPPLRAQLHDRWAGAGILANRRRKILVMFHRVGDLDIQRLDVFAQRVDQRLARPRDPALHQHGCNQAMTPAECGRSGEGVTCLDVS